MSAARAFTRSRCSAASSTAPSHLYTERIGPTRLAQAASRSSTSARPMRAPSSALAAADLGHVVGTEVAVRAEHGGGLEVVEGGHHAGPEEPEGRGRRAALQVDEDARHALTARRAPGERQDLGGKTRVDADAAQE